MFRTLNFLASSNITRINNRLARFRAPRGSVIVEGNDGNAQVEIDHARKPAAVFRHSQADEQNQILLQRTALTDIYPPRSKAGDNTDPDTS